MAGAEQVSCSAQSFGLDSHSVPKAKNSDFALPDFYRMDPSCCHCVPPLCDSGEVDLRWRPIAQALMEPLVIVKCKVVFKTGEQRRHRCVSIRIDVLVLDRAPETLDEDVVQSAATAIHADANASTLQDRREGKSSKLDTLVGIEYLWLTPCQRLLQSHLTEQAVQRIRELPGQHIAAMPIHDCHQVHEALSHWYIGDISVDHT